MNLLYFTLDDFDSLKDYHSINADLLREFTRYGHKVFVVSLIERKKGEKTHIVKEGHAVFLKQRIGNMQKTNVIEKGVSTVSIERILIHGIRKYFSGIKFDLVLYCTPPITFGKAVKYVKDRDGAMTYLLMKDIFPQNAVDLGMLSKTGLQGVLYRFFRMKEKELYRVSDVIGCMSPANVEYVLKHNAEVASRDRAARKSAGQGIVEVCPNCIEPVDKSISAEERKEIRKKYRIPLDRTAFIYGGNIGKPQGIGFMLKCLHSQRKNKKVFFFIVGSGTEYGQIERYIKKYKPENVVLHQFLPKSDFDRAVAACDIGMIFLDHRFTIPNFPSRILSYMQAKLPVLACTDLSTDIGKVIVDNGFGWWCESNDLSAFKQQIRDIGKSDAHASHSKMGERAFRYMNDRFQAADAYMEIIKHCDDHYGINT